MIDCKTIKECLTLMEPSDHSGLQNEERGLLFTIHTQFVLFNLTYVSKSIVSNSLYKYNFLFCFTLIHNRIHRKNVNIFSMM